VYQYNISTALSQGTLLSYRGVLIIRLVQFIVAQLLGVALSLGYIVYLLVPPDMWE
jgi:hypothetical protein